jgi:hypothetical protein
MRCPNIERIATMGYRVDEVHGYFKGKCNVCLADDRGSETNTLR